MFAHTVLSSQINIFMERNYDHVNIVTRIGELGRSVDKTVPRIHRWSTAWIFISYL